MQKKWKILLTIMFSSLLFFDIKKETVNSYFNRIRLRFGLNKKKTYILIDKPKKQYKGLDTVIHFFDYANNKAYQYVISQYGNSYQVIGLYDVY